MGPRGVEIDGEEHVEATKEHLVDVEEVITSPCESPKKPSGSLLMPSCAQALGTRTSPQFRFRTLFKDMVPGCLCFLDSRFQVLWNRSAGKSGRQWTGASACPCGGAR
jgi:hypothetical protein